MTVSTDYWLKRYVGIEFGVIDEEQEDQEEDLTVIDRELDEILKNLDKCLKPTDVVNRLEHHWQEYWRLEQKYMKYARKTDGVRARKHLLVIFHLVRARRMEILQQNKQLSYDRKHKPVKYSVVDYIKQGA